MSIPKQQNFSFTDKERQYLTYILEYTRLRGMPPAFADMQEYFEVTAPTVNQMIKSLDKKGFITRSLGAARSIFVNVPAELLILAPKPADIPFTKKQGEYLAFIYQYTKMRGFPPAFAEMEHYFGVTPPTVNQMIKNLEKKGLIVKEPRKARSIKVTLPAEQIPAV